MALFKCKMCGGALEIAERITVVVCEYCGTRQTLPKLNDDRRTNMYDRANHFRRNNEYDKAMGIYENILNEDNTDAEAYWSLVLCRYGIEYVEDPASHKRIPTVNRTQFTSIYDDDNYKSALQYADGFQRGIYEEEARNINEIQKGILEISQKEEPFDVFICYKENDNTGRRTQDSVLAQDLYFQLNQAGFKVFFARITLEDKLGSAYEPYIFAALNSAKVMVVLGTKFEYFNAVWVKNEWSRYLSLIKQGQKKMLIPAYRDMDPYDLPDEFSHLQAQDMSKLGFMQDLIRGIEKIVRSEEERNIVAANTIVREPIVTATNSSAAPLIRRMFMFLEDGKWSEAEEYSEKILDIEPECGEAYLGKLLVELGERSLECLKEDVMDELIYDPFDNKDSYKKILRFGSDELVREIKQCNEDFYKIRNNKLEEIRLSAKVKMRNNDINSLEDAIHLLYKIEDLYGMERWKDSDDLLDECIERYEKLSRAEKNDKIYSDAKAYMEENKIKSLEKAIGLFEKIPDWKNVHELKIECERKIKELKSEEDRLRVDNIYSTAESKMKLGDLESLKRAIELFDSIRGWKDSDMLKIECEKDSALLEAKQLLQKGMYVNAKKLLEPIRDYKDANEQLRIISGKERKDATFLRIIIVIPVILLVVPLVGYWILLILWS